MDERLAAGPAQEHLPPPSTGIAREAASGLDDPRALQILSTEHWSLLSQRSLVYNEAFARAGMFLTFVSATLVALGFVGNAMAFNRDFLVLAALLLFVDLVIGLATIGRMLDASVDDLRSIAGMNRIRNAYVRIAPAVMPYLSTGIHDDVAGVMQTYGAPRIRAGLPAFIHGLTTSGGMIMVIVSLLAGVLGGVLGLILGADLVGSFATGAIAFLVLFGLLNRYAYGVVSGFERTFSPSFPTPPEGDPQD
ncbi:MAG TPA: hypothetical protein VGI98_08510 [Candidatus Limnocylindrales bacterium]